jgi:DNA-binding response OmpR family regulator/anti-anti-sigma regulatory factor
VTKVLVSDSAELQRHFAAPVFAALKLDVVIVNTQAQALAMFATHQPAVAVLEADFAGPFTGFDTSRALKTQAKAQGATVNVIVVSRRLTADELGRVAASCCDELLVAPMSADELYDAVALALGLPRRGTEAFSTNVVTVSGPIAATVSNLSIDGLRLMTEVDVADGQMLTIEIATATEAAVAMRAHVIWAQRHDGRTVAGVAFDALDERARALLLKLTQWLIVNEGERTRVVLRGDFTEATKFDALLPQMVGRVVFDLAEITYMNSLGVRAWCEFLRAARIAGYEFHACSVPFIVQASMVNDTLGRGTVTSFFAPYHCTACEHQEERLLQTAVVLAASLQPPTFGCPRCGEMLEFDDLPERYLAFLSDED